MYETSKTDSRQSNHEHRRSEASPHASKAMTSTSSAMPSTSNAMSSTPKAMPSTSKATPSVSKAMPSTLKAMPSTSKAMPGTKREVFKLSEALVGLMDTEPGTSTVTPANLPVGGKTANTKPGVLKATAGTQMSIDSDTSKDAHRSSKDYRNPSKIKRSCSKERPSRSQERRDSSEDNHHRQQDTQSESKHCRPKSAQSLSNNASRLSKDIAERLDTDSNNTSIATSRLIPETVTLLPNQSHSLPSPLHSDALTSTHKRRSSKNAKIRTPSIDTHRSSKDSRSPSKIKRSCSKERPDELQERHDGSEDNHIRQQDAHSQSKRGKPKSAQTLSKDASRLSKDIPGKLNIHSTNTSFASPRLIPETVTSLPDTSNSLSSLLHSDTVTSKIERKRLKNTHKSSKNAHESPKNARSSSKDALIAVPYTSVSLPGPSKTRPSKSVDGITKRKLKKSKDLRIPLKSDLLNIEPDRSKNVSSFTSKTDRLPVVLVNKSVTETQNASPSTSKDKRLKNKRNRSKHGGNPLKDLSKQLYTDPSQVKNASKSLTATTTSFSGVAKYVSGTSTADMASAATSRDADEALSNLEPRRSTSPRGPENVEHADLGISGDVRDRSNDTRNRSKASQARDVLTNNDTLKDVHRSQSPSKDHSESVRQLLEILLDPMDTDCDKSQHESRRITTEALPQVTKDSSRLSEGLYEPTKTVIGTLISLSGPLSAGSGSSNPDRTTSNDTLRVLPSPSKIRGSSGTTHISSRNSREQLYSNSYSLKNIYKPKNPGSDMSRTVAQPLSDLASRKSGYVTSKNECSQQKKLYRQSLKVSIPIKRLLGHSNARSGLLKNADSSSVTEATFTDLLKTIHGTTETLVSEYEQLSQITQPAIKTAESSSDLSNLCGLRLLSANTISRAPAVLTSSAAELSVNHDSLKSLSSTSNTLLRLTEEAVDNQFKDLSGPLEITADISSFLPDPNLANCSLITTRRLSNDACKTNKDTLRKSKNARSISKDACMHSKDVQHLLKTSSVPLNTESAETELLTARASGLSNSELCSSVNAAHGTSPDIRKSLGDAHSTSKETRSLLKRKHSPSKDAQRRTKVARSSSEDADKKLEESPDQLRSDPNSSNRSEHITTKQHLECQSEIASVTACISGAVVIPSNADLASEKFLSNTLTGNRSLLKRSCSPSQDAQRTTKDARKHSNDDHSLLRAAPTLTDARSGSQFDRCPNMKVCIPLKYLTNQLYTNSYTSKSSGPLTAETDTETVSGAEIDSTKTARAASKDLFDSNPSKPLTSTSKVMHIPSKKCSSPSVPLRGLPDDIASAKTAFTDSCTKSVCSTSPAIPKLLKAAYIPLKELTLPQETNRRSSEDDAYKCSNDARSLQLDSSDQTYEPYPGPIPMSKAAKRTSSGAHNLKKYVGGKSSSEHKLPIYVSRYSKTESNTTSAVTESLVAKNVRSRYVKTSTSDGECNSMNSVNTAPYAHGRVHTAAYASCARTAQVPYPLHDIPAPTRTPETKITPGPTCAQSQILITSPNTTNVPTDLSEAADGLALPLHDTEKVLSPSGVAPGHFKYKHGRFLSLVKVDNAGQMTDVDTTSTIGSSAVKSAHSPIISDSAKQLYHIPLSFIPLPESQRTVTKRETKVPPILLNVLPVSAMNTIFSQNAAREPKNSDLQMQPSPCTEKSIRSKSEHSPCNALSDTSNDLVGSARAAIVSNTVSDFSEPRYCAATNISRTKKTARDRPIYYACEPPRYSFTRILTAIRSHKAKQDAIRTTTKLVSSTPDCSRTISNPKNTTPVPASATPVRTSNSLRTASSPLSSLPKHVTQPPKNAFMQSTHTTGNQRRASRLPNYCATRPRTRAKATRYTNTGPKNTLEGQSPMYVSGSIRHTTAPPLHAKAPPLHEIAVPRYATEAQIYASQSPMYATGSIRHATALPRHAMPPTLATAPPTLATPPPTHAYIRPTRATAVPRHATEAQIYAAPPPMYATDFTRNATALSRHTTAPPTHATVPRTRANAPSRHAIETRIYAPQSPMYATGSIRHATAPPHMYAIGAVRYATPTPEHAAKPPIHAAKPPIHATGQRTYPSHLPIYEPRPVTSISNFAPDPLRSTLAAPNLLNAALRLLKIASDLSHYANIPSWDAPGLPGAATGDN